MSDLTPHSKPFLDSLALLRKQFPVELHKHIYLVGGSVRDHLLGNNIHDIDLLSDLDSATISKLRFRHVQGKSTQPIWFKSHPLLSKIEISLLAPGQAVDDELMTRDFRCNAIAMTLDGVLFDPLGGQADILNRVLNPCSKRSLDDDPVRIFRAFRFECHGWKMSPELVESIKRKQWDEQLALIPVERLTREMLKAMSGPRPELFFERMLELNIGTCYLPEIFRMSDIPAGPSKYHGTDTVFSHSIDVLRRMATMTENPTARLVAFFHDLGKLVTPADQLPRHIGHDRAGEVVARQLATRIRLPANLSRAMSTANKLHLIGGSWTELREATKLSLAEKASKGGIADFFPLLVKSDRNQDSFLDGWQEVLDVSRLNSCELGIVIDELASISEKDRKGFLVQRRVSELKRRLSSG